MKSRKGGWEHSREIRGVVFLAAAVFLTLCLFSYDARDPSLLTLAVGRRVHNLGGIVGSSFAELLIQSIGWTAYLIPLVLLGLSFTYLAGRNLPDFKMGWPMAIAYGIFLLFATFLAHFQFGAVEIGDRPGDAGGIIGGWVGGYFARGFGRSGAYLLTVFGLAASLIFVTRLSLVQGAKVLHITGFALFRRLWATVVSFVIVAYVRSLRAIGRWWHQLKVLRTKRVEPKVHRPQVVQMNAVSPSMHRSTVAPSSASSLTPSPPESASLSTAVKPEKTVGVGEPKVGEPKILPRRDLKEEKKIGKDQLELITPLFANYQIPQLSFLDSEARHDIKIDEDNLKMNSRLLERKLLDYDVEGRITEIHPGPVITMYEFEPAAGVKVNKIVNLEDDLSLTMGGKSVRIIAPLPGKAAVGIEIPNNARETVWLKDVIGHPKFQRADSKLTLAIGKDTEGIPFVADLAKMPHLLMAGATGAGKSVGINAMILSILYKATPEEVRLIMIDPKMLELSIYEKIPHLLLPVVTNPKKASMALRWAVREMERRYEVLTQKGARHIAGYNKTATKEEKLPYIVVIIDELADLMMTAAKDVEASITRLAQMARAAGIHLILATQRPSVDVLTGIIKANFPARISYKVSSKHDSRTIIDTVGSEHLLGYGDMLFLSGVSNMIRVHGAFVSETEINRVVEHWRKQGEPEYLDESVLKPIEEETTSTGGIDDIDDELYDQAVTIVTETRQASISMIQRRLRIGYNRAARMVERMEKEGVVGPADGARPREVYAQSIPGPIS